MLMRDMKESFCRPGRLATLVSMAAIVAASATMTLANGGDDDDWDTGEDCLRRPTCEIQGLERGANGDVMYIPECVSDGPYDASHRCEASFNAWVDLQCEDSENMRIRYRVNGALVETRNLDDLPVRQQAHFEIPNFHQYEEGDRIRVKIRVIDRDNDTWTECLFWVEVICGRKPICRFNGEEMDDDHNRPRNRPVVIYDVKPGDILPVIEVCAKSRCGERARVEMFARPPFMKPAGHIKGGRDRWVCLETKADDVVESGFAEGTYWAKFRCSDVKSGRSRVLIVGYRYTDPEPEPESCDDLPVCEVLEGSSITVDAGMTGLLTVCGSTTCDECDVSIAMTDGPAFVTLYESDVPGADDGVCDSYMVSPGADDAGSHMVTFTVTDCNGATSECAVEVIVPEPDPLRACTENEEALPNDTFADASVIDSGECVDAFGVNIYGVLETPVFVNGDVDYYRIVGLTPDETYIATIVAGMNSEHGFTDTMLGWLVADGVLMTKDDNSGPLAGYSMITFTADSEGVATLAITGHGDDDFNGMMDPSMAFEEYGSGGYMLSIRAAQGDTMPVEQQADLNADGVVDTGDLGILLGLFGATSN